MESSASFSIRFCHWALVRIPTLLARLALAEVKSDADTLAVTDFLQPSVIPFGILPCGGRRLVRSGCFGLRLWLLGNGLGSSGLRFG